MNWVCSDRLDVDRNTDISLTRKILEALQNEGFKAAGIASAVPHPEDTEHIRAWIAEGRHAGMEFLVRGSERIGDITSMVSGARSVIMAAIPYRLDDDAGAGGEYFIARYGRARDYHKVVTRKLKRVAALIAKESPGAVSKVFCDSSSVTEKEWAVRTGIGWRGKHSIIINEKLGSFIFLGGIVTTVSLEYNESRAPDRCGTCRRCIDGCPTGAICSDRTIDARRCLAWMTIESHDDIPEWVGSSIENIIYGCDRCQEVCPWNSGPAPAPDHEFIPDTDITAITREQWISMSGEEFAGKFAESAIRRAGLDKIRNSIRFVDRQRSR